MISDYSGIARCVGRTTLEKRKSGGSGNRKASPAALNKFGKCHQRHSLGGEDGKSLVRI